MTTAAPRVCDDNDLGAFYRALATRVRRVEKHRAYVADHGFVLHDVALWYLLDP